MGIMRVLVVVLVSLFVFSSLGMAQSLGNAGTLEGKVTDPSGAALPQAKVVILNRITNYTRTLSTDAEGTFRFTNVPANSYHLEVSAPNFSNYEQDVSIRSVVPVSLKIEMALAGTKTSVTVEAAGADLLDNVPYAHNDIDTKSLEKFPIGSPASGVSDAILFGTGAVVADSNGFFHPLGDHAQTSFSVDGQPISDQQSKNFSTQIPLDAIQSMELITGAPPAEFGDKTSLVVNAVTRSGLGQKNHGSLQGEWGSFGNYSEEATLGLGGAKVGNFIAVNMLRSGRFLDTPEFLPVHAIGNNGTVFDRFDYQPSSKDAIHFNLFGARNWFQIPNTYDQAGQDQRQKITTFNFAPGYQHTFSPTTLFTVNPFYRIDHVNYYPSRDPQQDTPATLAQMRSLANWGVKADVSYAKGRHNAKAGTQLMQTRLDERFALGITDPLFNAICVDRNELPLASPGVIDPRDCANAGFRPNPDLLPGLIPYDLTRGGKLFQFNGAGNINQFAFFVQDAVKLGKATLQAGLRVDQYNGVTSNTGVQPRLGISYLLHEHTILRGSYSRTFETPYNENLLLSSRTGQGGLASNVFGVNSQPLRPGTRNQFNAGLQQAIGKFLVADADYFWKFTDGAYDFGNLFNTPIHFPISWKKSKIDGVAVRLSTPNLHGFQVFNTMGHTRARYFGPEIGGLLFNSPVESNVFRIDHDQAFQQRTNVRYQHGKEGVWIAFTWRYESGVVAGAVEKLDDVLALTGAEQAAIGLSCGARVPSTTSALTASDCTLSNYSVSRLVIPKPGTENPDHNPPRIAARHLFDLGLGTDNLFHTEHVRTTLRFTATNLGNNVALYNFHSTFSGTHFVAPRSYQAAIGIVF